MVYINKNIVTGNFRIGKANNPEDRLASHQSGNDCKLILVVAIEGGYPQESRIHKRFRHLLIHGSWYKPGKDLLEFIELMKTTEGSIQFAKEMKEIREVVINPLPKLVAPKKQERRIVIETRHKHSLLPVSEKRTIEQSPMPKLRKSL